MKFQYSLIIIGLLSFCLYFPGRSQSYVDLAQQFSQREITGSARMQGMGGVSSSLGGDVTSAIKNPAGLGFFNRSELSFSPSIGFHNTDAKYLGRNSDDFKTNFNFGHLGVVLNNTKQNPEGAWRGGSFGISMNRINDFHSQIRYSGRNSGDDFVGSSLHGAYYSNGTVAFDNIYSELAFEAYLIDQFYDPVTDEYFLDTYNDRAVVSGFPVEQSEGINIKGAGYTTNFAYGGNFADKFYFGVGINLSSINYEMSRVYKERPTSTALDEVTLAENRQFSGSGFNVSLGAIYRPISTLTVGLAYTSPTYYTLEDYLTVDLIADYGDSTNYAYFPYDNISPIINYEYRRPAHLNGGLSYFIGKNGFITADVEYINYGGNKYSSNENDFSVDNQEIGDVLQSVINYKIGGEYRYSIFRFRAGFAFFGDPIGEASVDRSRKSFSLGAGIRLRDYYIDLAAVNTRYETGYVPYAEGPLAVAKHNSTRAMLTFGLNF